MKTDFQKISVSSYFFRRRIKTLTRIFYLFIFLTILFTAYLYGMIEIDSQKVVFKILPSSFNSHNSLNGRNHFNNKKSILQDRQSSTSDDNSHPLASHQRPLNNFNAKLIGGGSNNLKKSMNQFKQNKKHLNKVEHLNVEKNISKLFASFERYSLQITTLLRPHEASNVADLKEKFDLQAKYRKLKIKEEFKKLKVKQNNNGDSEHVHGEAKPLTVKVNAAANETAAASVSETSYDDLNLIGPELTSNEIITREIMVKFLRYGNFMLKKKPSKALVTIKTLLNQYDSNKELDINELPAIWNKYFLKISEFQLYNDTEAVNEILKAMSTSPVVSCHEKEKGTQIKLLLLLEDGTDVLVKPMKVARNYETPPDHFYFVDFERHHAEIAAFHVDRVLGLNRVPPTVGRLFNMTSDLWMKAESELAKTFFYSPVGNTCFTGHCSYYCDTTHAICGKPGDKMEGSVQLLLPSKPLVHWRVTSHPYRRTYNKKKKAEWEINEQYCVENIFQDDTYQSKLILDIMDMAVFDFITGNMDRHHYERMISLSNYTFSLHLDNGRSFGKQYYDEMSILAPLKQCCLFRYSTFRRLKYLYKIGFSKLLDESLKIDPLYPILTDDHLKAVDRRLEKILLEVYKCTEKFLPTQVIVDDGY